MKNLIFVILASMSILALYSCEKTEMQKTNVFMYNDLIIEYRSDCEECPGISECCCAVYLQNPLTEDANLEFCGTSDGAGFCTGGTVGDCVVNGGGGQTITLEALNPRQRFCMIQGNSFWIRNTSSTTAANIYISCQEDITNPQIIQVTIPANSRFFYSVDGSCELELCTD